MGTWSIDFISDMERMRREMDRFLDELGTSSWTFPFSRTTARIAKTSILTRLRRAWIRIASTFLLHKTSW